MKIRTLLAFIFIFSAVMSTSCGAKKSSKSSNSSTESFHSVYKGQSDFGVDVYLHLGTTIAKVEIKETSSKELLSEVNGTYKNEGETILLLNGVRASDGRLFENFGTGSEFKGEGCFDLSVPDSGTVEMCKL